MKPCSIYFYTVERRSPNVWNVGDQLFTHKKGEPVTYRLTAVHPDVKWKRV